MDFIYFKEALLENYPDVLDIQQLCEILNISVATGYQLLRQKKIESLKVGRAYRIPKIYLLRYLQINAEKD